MTATKEPQIIRASSGEELVVIPRVEYDKLVASAADAEADGEDAADLFAARAAKVEWEAAGRPVVPLAVLRRVRAGDTFLKAFRAERGLTQSQLAKKAGIAQGYISEIESEHKTPNAEVREALAKALAIHAVWLTEDAPRAHRELGA